MDDLLPCPGSHVVQVPRVGPPVAIHTAALFSACNSVRIAKWLCKCLRLTEPLGQPKPVVIFMQCQYFTSESHQLASGIFCLGERRKRLMKIMLILFEFFILSIFSTGYFNVQVRSDSSNTFRINYLG